MNSKEYNTLKTDIEKLRFQVELLAQSLNWQEHPIAGLVSSLDWSANDLDKAHDIFEKYDELLEKNKELVSWYEFECEFKRDFGIGYQTLKRVVLAFYYNSQWVDLCIEYAKAKPCLELDIILRNENLI